MRRNYSIVDTSPEYQKCLEHIPSNIKKDLDLKLEILQDDPFSIAKELRAPLQGKYSVRIDRGYRLECRIDLNSHKIFLLFIGPRSEAYKRMF